MDPNTGHLFPIPENAIDLYKVQQEEILRREIDGEFDRLKVYGPFPFEEFNTATDRLKVLLGRLPHSRARSLALTKLDEFVLWTTQAVSPEQEPTGFIGAAARDSRPE